MSSSRRDGDWLPSTALDPCVFWLKQQAYEIARRDPPLAGADLYLNDHGVPHIDAVLGFAGLLATTGPGGFITSFTEVEKATLYAGVLSHDLGLYRPTRGITVAEARMRHAALSGDWCRAQIGRGGLSEDFVRVLAMVVEAHARSVPIEKVELYTRIPESTQMVRPRLIAAMLRIADSLDIGQGRTPVAVYRHFEEQIPEGSAAYWAAHTLVTGCELDLLHREVVLHLRHGADPADPLIRMLYLALQAEFDLIPENYWDSQGCIRLHVTFAQGGTRISPGKVYGELLESGVPR